MTSSPNVSTYDEFQKLPILDRATLNQFSPVDRLCTPISAVDDIRSTSGTSGQMPLFYFRTTGYRHMARVLVQAGARRKIYLWGYQHVITHVENDRLEGLQTVICDPQQLPQHVPLVSAMKADTLAGTPSLLLLFGQLLDNIDDRLRIRFLELTGEPGRPQTMMALRQVFPLAKIYHHYAMGEMGLETGIRTPKCDRQDSGYFHLNPEGIFAEEHKGELLLTHLNTPTAFPLIRYKTGDRINWLRHDRCQCGHEGISFELSGRSNVDFVRIAGVELRYDEIAGLLTQFDDALEPYLAVEVSEHISDAKQQVTLILKIVAKGAATLGTEQLAEQICGVVSQNLKLSATTRLKDMIDARYFTSPKVKFLPELPVSTKAPGIRLVER
ncbi:phenylacetate--CoA ligase [Roseovarius sp. EL26]|uniref:phenylacetate--CoA ligase n=1 Tax=Roseovarius sp. EL26 TaxID=2126672 RepID=UPI0013C41C81|nr:phenylacetate--CoA ligase [Roseovarius sp. EL26]